MSEQEQTARQAWHALERFWSPFSFLLSPGATKRQIDVWQKKEGVTLQPDVRALIGVHGPFGVPASGYTDFSAEVTLSAIDQWIRFDRSFLNEEVDPDFWPELFTDHNCPSTSMEDYVAIGSDPSGADYGIYVILHLESSTVFGITWNAAEIEAFGTMTAWLTERRLGGLKNVAEYPAIWNENMADEAGGASLAKWHRSYLELANPERLARWDKVEAKFIPAFDRLAAGTAVRTTSPGESDRVSD